MSNYTNHVVESLNLSDQNYSKLCAQILAMDGLSGQRTRHFYNNLCSLPNAKYLEVGCWKGSSTCAAMYGNNMTVYAIDNFSEFGGPKEEFANNVFKYRGTNDFHFVEKDCWKVTAEDLNNVKFNIYLYDGAHEYEDQYNAVKYYKDFMEDEFILIVDDYNWYRVSEGTEQAIKDCNLEVVYKQIILTTNDGSHTPIHTYPYSGMISQWHNGIGIFVLKKL